MEQSVKTPKETSAYGVHALGKKHKLIKRVRKNNPFPEIHGTKVWGSSYLLMDYLENHPIAKGSRVMDLGCGWGALSIYCAKRFKARVTAVDADKHVFAYLAAQASYNRVELKTKRKRFEDLKTGTLAKQSLIIGSDICFWDELTDALYQTIKRARKSGGAKIIIADPGRSPFMKLAKKCRKRLGGELIEYSLEEPVVADGYLLVIG